MEPSTFDITKELAFSKQFVITPKTFHHALLDPWHTRPFTETLAIHTHPALNTAAASHDATELLGLGIFLDPFHPERGDQDILEALAQSASSFQELERCMANLGGRWVLAGTINGESRVYHDAGGLKPLFYTDQGSGGLYAASQPSLLHALGLVERDDALFERFEQYPNSNSWPVHVVPYAATSQLLPNHYLDTATRQAGRYWPSEALAQRSVDEAAPEMLSILQGMIDAACTRRSCLMHITGGYDSRLVLAAAERRWPDVMFSTIKRSDIMPHDVFIPKAIAKKFNLNHQLFDPRKHNQGVGPDNTELTAILQRNVGGMARDRSCRNARTTWAVAGDRLVLPGAISEILRCFYYPDGSHPENLSPQQLAKRAGFRNNPIAERGFSKWAETLPKIGDINPLDLLYWEHRSGVWAACNQTYREGIVDLAPPMNCRRFLELGLSTPVEARMHPYRLVRRITELAKPELLAFPYNFHWLDRWQNINASTILPKARRAWRLARSKAPTPGLAGQR